MENSGRQLSLDVFRGITVALMIVVNTPGSGDTTYAPLHHAHWHGFTPTDWVFPTFMFVVGNAMAFSLIKYEGLGNAEFLKKVFKRTFIIFLLGFLMYWFPFFKDIQAGDFTISPPADTRVFGVLQRIALGYFFGSLILHYVSKKGALIFCGVALLGYWFILYAFGDYSLEGNAVLALDKFILGESHLYHGEGIAFDPEGILSTLPSIVNVMAGYFAGRFLQQKGHSYETIAKFMLTGAACLFIALCWNETFPINKKLWTSSFVVLTVGLDLMILAILIYLIEIVKSRRWTYFFEVFGKNTLFIYLLSEVGVILLYAFQVSDKSAYSWIYTSVFRPTGNYLGSLLFALSWMLICWLVGYAMDKKKIYVKV
jgi:predicted acyltransferase